MTKFLSTTLVGAFLPPGLFRLYLQFEIGQVEKLDIAGLHRSLFHGLARNGQQPHDDAVLGAHILGDGVVQPHLELPAEDVQLLPSKPLGLGRSILDLRYRNRSIHRTDVDESAALSAVNMVALDRLGLVEFEDEAHVGRKRSLLIGPRLVAEGDPLPVLALVLAKVENFKRSASALFAGVGVFDAEIKQTFAGGVDCETAEVATDPAAVEFLGNGESCPGAAKKVSNKIPWLLARFNDIRSSKDSGFCVA